MRPNDGGGGGGRIVIDPATLKASASRLKGAVAELRQASTAIGHISLPDMPPDVVGTVRSALSDAAHALSGDPALLDSAVVELTRRAFLAEYADRMMAGYALTGQARKDFLAWMKDGTLLQYADRNQGEAAGRELAKLYTNFRDEPQQLIDLSKCLQGAERWGAPDVEQAFGAGFVNEFGAKNMELVPRVIQALEYSQQLVGDMSIDPHLLRDVAARWQGNELHDNPLDLLAPFSIALANATMSGRLTRTTEDAIVNDPDTWATAALMSKGTFSTHFLVNAFKSGVVDKIAQDSLYYGGGAYGMAPQDAPYSLGMLWSQGKEGLPYDSKQIVLDALARNPEAARQALTTNLSDVQVWDMGSREDVSNPLDLVYKYGHFDDDGSAFGHAYLAATDDLNADRNDLASMSSGAGLTQHALTLMLDNDHDGMAGFKDGLASDLAHHHIADLFDSAVANHVGDSVDVIDGSLVRIPQTQLNEIFQKFGDHPSSLATVLHSGSIYQGALISEGTSHGPHAPADWAYKAGAFDATVLNAADLHRLDDFNEDDERHKLIAGFFKDVINDTVTIENPIAATVLHNGVDQAIDSVFPGPDIHNLIDDNTEARAIMSNSIHASIAGGYYQHGYLHGAPSSIVDSQNQLISYGDATGDARWHYEEWLNSDPHVEQVSQKALSEVTRAFSEHDIDLVR